MSWYSLSPEIQNMILAELSYLDPTCVEDFWMAKPFNAWRSEWLNYLLVCRVWNSFLQHALTRNNSLGVIMTCASEAICVQVLRATLEEYHENVMREGCGYVDGLWGVPLSLPDMDRPKALLSIAGYRQFLSCMSLLLKNGVNSLWEDNEEGVLLLNNAIETGNIAAVELLVQHGAVLDYNSPRDWPNPLALAASLGNVEIMELLLEAGADPDVGVWIYSDCLGDLVQTAARPQYSVDMMEVLLNSGVIPGDDEYPMHLHPLVLATKWNNVDVVQLLLDRVEVGVNIVRAALEGCTVTTNSEIKWRLLEMADLPESEEQY